ncbi:hypothetical protein QYM36_013476 [Artemia franciscana]|uniref:Thiolase N-terminal domain-containing protein n=1 Tax=Artemia franciscana TaxID=6661 RepID=A0AA88L236_ARTSF|nr:hypothetical protein QYM36_013476 [Artemia franciscana]
MSPGIKAVPFMLGGIYHNFGGKGDPQLSCAGDCQQTRVGLQKETYEEVDSEETRLVSFFIASFTRMKCIFVVGAKRTPFGAFGGKLANKSCVDLHEIAAKAALASENVNPELIDSVVIGNVLAKYFRKDTLKVAKIDVFYIKKFFSEAWDNHRTHL